MPRTIPRTLPLGLVAILATAGSVAAQEINTGPPNPALNLTTTGFGRAAANSYLSMGQSFLVPAGGFTQLTSFDFWMRGTATTPGSVPYRAYIFAWDASTARLSGGPLFRSDAQSFVGPAANTLVSFATGGVNLTAGQSYIAVLSAVEFADAPLGVRGGPVYTTSWPASSYAGGSAFEAFSPSTGLAGAGQRGVAHDRRERGQLGRRVRRPVLEHGSAAADRGAGARHRLAARGRPARRGRGCPTAPPRLSARRGRTRRRRGRAIARPRRRQALHRS
jgi:hypothetical protein